MKKIQVLFITVIVLIAASSGVYLIKHDRQTVTVSSYATASDITYKGQKGKDALTLLKHEATVGQANSGLVTSINGLKADNAKREYWAFYINGHLASIGPADYETKNNDTITWKLEKY